MAAVVASTLVGRPGLLSMGLGMSTSQERFYAPMLSWLSLYKISWSLSVPWAGHLGLSWKDGSESWWAGLSPNRQAWHNTCRRRM